MSQITGRMTADERDRFGDYARALRLDGGTVATLLISRELRIGRLASLWKDGRFHAAGSAPGTITSHRLGDAEKEEFYKHVADHQLPSKSKALGMLCRVELTEHWLEKALNDPGDSDRVGS